MHMTLVALALALLSASCAPPPGLRAGVSYRYRYVGRPGYGVAYVRAVPREVPEVSVHAVEPSVRDDYRMAAASYAGGRYQETEEILYRIYDRDRNPVTLLNIARCSEQLRRYDDAVYDLVRYFGSTLSSAQSADGAESLRQARGLLKKIAKEKGNKETSGRKLAAGSIAEISAGHYEASEGIDTAFRLTYDFSLLYWMVLAEFRAYQQSFCPAPRCSYQHFTTFTLEKLKVRLNAYFLGATDLADLTEARVLLDEVEAEYRKEVARERAARSAQERLQHSSLMQVQEWNTP